LVRKTTMKTDETEPLPDKDTSGKHAVSRNGMVSTAFPEATEAGVEMLRQGGNAVDATCASALALSVCEPQASGIGGQTMMLIYTGKKVIAVDGSSRAPSLAHVSAIYKRDRKVGYLAATVPSTPATLFYVHQRYGSLPWERILQPAMHCAIEGYRITVLQNRLQERQLKNFKKVESGSGSHYFLKNGQLYQAGDLFCQPDLARLLKILAAKGIEEFYKGKVAKQIDADMRENGGLLRYDDLALIPWPIERRIIRRRFRKYRVYTMPPPGAGRTLLFALLMADSIPAKILANDKFKRCHLLAGIFRKALLERSDRPFDPEFYPKFPKR